MTILEKREDYQGKSNLDTNKRHRPDDDKKPTDECVQMCKIATTTKEMSPMTTKKGKKRK